MTNDERHPTGLLHSADEEFDALVKKTVAEYDPYWKPCIILNVDN